LASALLSNKGYVDDQVAYSNYVLGTDLKSKYWYWRREGNPEEKTESKERKS
jgi:hypothetical protein